MTELPSTAPEGESQSGDNTAVPPPSIPPGFMGLSRAISIQYVQHNVIGVCVDFLEPCKSRGTDYTMKFKLIDPAWGDQIGMAFRFFKKDPAAFPPIQNQGDVVILRNVKTTNYQGLCGLSNDQTTWIVIPNTALEDSLEDMRSKAKFLGQHDAALWPRAGPPNDQELLYAKHIANHQSAGFWPTLKGSTALQIEDTIRSSGGIPPPRKMKYRELKDLDTVKPLYFVELLGEVRKMWSADNRTELYITDYTTNARLHKYSAGTPDDNGGDGSYNGREGDEFSYIKPTIGQDDTKWPGPWGRMTLDVTLWDEHHTWAAANVKEGNFVYLRNVKMQLDRGDGRLRGKCHGEGPYTLNVEVRKPSDASVDEQMKALLQRKREYEITAKSQHLNFARDPANKKRPQAEIGDFVDQEPKSKKAKARERKRKQSKKDVDTTEGDGVDNTSIIPKRSNLTSNPNVRCHNYDVPIKPLAEILDPSILERKTPAGTPYRFPFQNCTYKTKIRIVDYFPDNIVDFAVPRRVTEYDVLSDNGSGYDSDSDISQPDNNQVKWSWRFILLVEDARPRPYAAGSSPRMELLVADEDGDFLLNQEAFDMRDAKNANQLVRVQEKLFHLWGDLQEKKEEATENTAEGFKPDSRPFECLIKEYGVKMPTHPMQSTTASHDYRRMFRMFGVTI